MNGISRELAAALTAFVYLGSLSCDGPAGPGASRRWGAGAGTVAQQRQAQLAPPTLTPFLPLGPQDSTRPDPYALTVSNTGEAVWSMALRTPPGRNGVEPHLGLEYRSRGANGIIGLGFSVTGLSSVTRCWSTPASDGHWATPTDQGAPDGYCLDGQRLRPIAGSATQFHPEQDPGTLVTIANPGVDQSFEVRYRNGLIAQFGGRDTGDVAGSSMAKVAATPIVSSVPNPLTSDLVAEVPAQKDLTLAWNIDRMSDRWGNFYEVDYDRARNGSFIGSSDSVGTPLLTGVPTLEVVPKQLRWTGFNGATQVSPSRTVDFSYSTSSKLDPRTEYVAGVALQRTKLLSAITISAEDRLVSDPRTGLVQRPFVEYRFSYETPAQNTRILDRLHSVTECVFSSSAHASAQCLDPVTFSWKGLNNALVPRFLDGSSSKESEFVVTPTGQTGGARDFDVWDLTVGDFNGDGRDDVLYRLPDRAPSSDDVPCGATGQFAQGSWYLRLGTGNGLSNLIPSRTRSGAQGLQGLPKTCGGAFRFSARAVDLDGDGKAEVVLYSEPIPDLPDGGSSDPTPSRYQSYRFNGSDFVAQGISEDLVVPFDGSRPRRSFGLLTGDFDGDSLADLLHEKATAGMSAGEHVPLQLHLGTGSLTFSSSGTTVTTGGATALDALLFDERLVADLDGKGLIDVLTPFVSIQGQTASHFVFSRLSLSTAAIASTLTTTLSAADVEGSDSLSQLLGLTCSKSGAFTHFSRYLIDLNGDGLPDSVAFPARANDQCATVRICRLDDGGLDEHRRQLPPAAARKIRRNKWSEPVCDHQVR
ncbi:MAG: SpvB/TcaC N-terminal domain-containing protein [Myxococcaceae bacterium]